ncbi:MAG: hypothetical protein DWQ20_00885 [Actinobacteria bacterium]|nr:MAG: hypothetical protein DWQ20_00885 [Actinomycetota bacterium]
MTPRDIIIDAIQAAGKVGQTTIDAGIVLAHYCGWLSHPFSMGVSIVRQLGRDGLIREAGFERDGEAVYVWGKHG